MKVQLLDMTAEMLKDNWHFSAGEIQHLFHRRGIEMTIDTAQHLIDTVKEEIPDDSTADANYFHNIHRPSHILPD